MKYLLVQGRIENSDNTYGIYNGNLEVLALRKIPQNNSARRLA